MAACKTKNPSARRRPAGCTPGIFGEGSRVSTNQKPESGAFSLLTGRGVGPFPFLFNCFTLKTPVICLLIISVIRLTVVSYSSIVSYTYNR